MAKPHLSLAFFLLVALLSSLHVHGRESKFFSKVTHVPEAAAPAPAPAEPEADSQTGYGLFGHDETDTKDQNKTPTEGLTGESFEATNNNNGYNTNSERQGMSDTRFMENGKYYYDPSNENTNSGGLGGESFMSTNNNNGYTNSEGVGGESFMSTNNNNNYNYNTNANANNEGLNGERYQGHAATYNSERQGMSDTRFMENGKYYYDPSNDNNNNNNNNGYNTNQEGITGESLMSTNNNNNGYTNTNNYNTNREGLTGESLMSTNTNNNGYTNNKNGYANMERQGMSDTRFMENGKYYYDPSNENTNTNNYNKEGINGESLMSNTNGYGEETERQGRDNYVGGFETEQEQSNNNERYEFDTMEEYEKYQQSKHHGYSP